MGKPETGCWFLQAFVSSEEAAAPSGVCREKLKSLQHGGLPSKSLSRPMVECSTDQSLSPVQHRQTLNPPIVERGTFVTAAMTV